MLQIMKASPADAPAQVAEINAGIEKIGGMEQSDKEKLFLSKKDNVIAIVSSTTHFCDIK